MNWSVRQKAPWGRESKRGTVKEPTWQLESRGRAAAASLWLDLVKGVHAREMPAT